MFAFVVRDVSYILVLQVGHNYVCAKRELA
jgi:hypothetical protein